MQDKSIAQKILGVWNTKTVVTVAIGAALYGVLMVYGGIPVFTNTSLSTALLVPVIVGGMTGAVPTMVALFLGNVLADLIGGWGMWFDWSIGNGILGFFVGLLPVYGAYIQEGIFKVKHAIIYAITCIVGNAVAFILVTPILSRVLYGSEESTTFMQALVALAANSFVLVVIGIPVLFLMANRFKARTNLSEDEDGESDKK